MDTHFDARGRLGRIVPALSQINSTLGVGIDESACVYYKDGIGTLYGKNGAFVVDTSSTLKVESQYFHLKNIKLHYLTEGDSFNFKTRKLTTSKHPLSPTKSGFSDSQNILSNYECTRLITGLLDQTANENLGKTKIPEDEDYPRNTPLFDLLFYKGADTKGYKTGNSYTAENIWIDFSAEVRA